jgi:hypothetical protein
MASVRKQRLKAVDDLRDIADSLEQAADLFEDTLGDLDSVASDGIPRTGKHMPYEEMEERVRTFGLLMPSKLAKAVETHLAGEHDPEDCPVCFAKSSPPRGWLSNVWSQYLKPLLREAIENGELEDQVSEAMRQKIRNEAIEDLVERGWQRPAEKGDR